MEKIKDIKTYILIAWIFGILALVGFGFWAAYVIIIDIIWHALLGPLVGGFFAAAMLVAIIPSLIFSLMFAVPTALVFVRLNRMKRAADKGDVDELKELNSMGWAIVALILGGFVTGIMLLIAHGPIEELGKATPTAPGAGVTMESLDRISKIKALLDSGAISKEEFESQKKLILKPEEAPSAHPSGVEDELKRLKQLYDSGALTTAEYEEQKKRALQKP